MKIGVEKVLVDAEWLNANIGNWIVIPESSYSIIFQLVLEIVILMPKLGGVAVALFAQ